MDVVAQLRQQRRSESGQYKGEKTCVRQGVVVADAPPRRSAWNREEKLWARRSTRRQHKGCEGLRDAVREAWLSIFLGTHRYKVFFTWRSDIIPSCVHMLFLGPQWAVRRRQLRPA